MLEIFGIQSLRQRAQPYLRPGTKEPEPAAVDLGYRQNAKAVIALGLFRASDGGGHMKRRDFVSYALIGGVGTLSSLKAVAGDQMRRVGVLMSIAEGDPEGSARVQAFEEALQSLNWTAGRNFALHYYWAAGDADLMRSYAGKLVAMNPDVILANSPQVTAAILSATRTIPIIFVQVADPIGSGFVASLAKPGGNLTGFASFQPELGGKWVEILKDIAPWVTRVGVVLDPRFTGYVALSRVIMAAAPSFGMTPMIAEVHDELEIERAITTFAREPDSGLIVLPSPVTAVHRALIAKLAAESRLPAVYPYRYFSEVGGVIAYAIDPIDLYRRAASYVDRVLKGERPANLPVQQPVKFEMVINLKTAKAIGLRVAGRLIARADEVIE
jgi:putative ABC transport system substrate-binding protein